MEGTKAAARSAGVEEDTDSGKKPNNAWLVIPNILASAITFPKQIRHYLLLHKGGVRGKGLCGERPEAAGVGVSRKRIFIRATDNAM